MNINKIKDLYESGEGNRFFFSKDTMKFFGQTLRMFKVKKISDTEYLIYAPSYWWVDGKKKFMGISQRIFKTTDNDLHDVPDDLKINEVRTLDDIN